MSKRAWGISAALCVALVGTVQAQALNWGEEYAKRIKATEVVGPLSDDVFGDQVNLFNGTVSFSVTDVSLPGNSALAVELVRTFDTQDVSSGRPVGQWDLDVPRLSGVHPDTQPWGPAQRCSTVAPPPNVTQGNYVFLSNDYWSGNQLQTRRGGGDLLAITPDPKLVKPSFAADFKWVTKDGWFLSCLPSLQSGHSGEGFLAHAPDGTRYYFDWMVLRPYPLITKKDPSSLTTAVLARNSIRLYATRVEDRFGNWVQYDWGGGRLNRIYANDGREITLSYDASDGRLLSATAAGKTWNYEYANLYALSSVVNPDGSRWQYGHGGTGTVNRIAYMPDPNFPEYSGRLERDDEAYCWPTNKLKDETPTFSVTHPAGATATFSFAPKRHGRANVRFNCMSGSDDDPSTDYNFHALTHEVMSLSTKHIAGPGLAGSTYVYGYSGLEAGYAPKSAADDALTLATPPPHYKYVSVTQPDGSKVVSRFGKDYMLNEGQLMQVDVIDTHGQTQRTSLNTYVTDAEAAALPFPASMGGNMVAFGDSFTASALRPVKSATITQQSVAFNNVTQLFDAHARPLTVGRSSILGPVKADVTIYHDDLAKWVLGQVAMTSTNGIQVSSTTFDANALPWKTYSFGNLQSTLTYNLTAGPEAGTLHTIADARNNTTTLSNWKRGIPQTIAHPDGKTESALVNDNGWIDSVTDENGAGFTTGYTYDQMGRLASITYPAGDSTAWLPTTLSFQPAAVDEYGLAPGHWKQTINTGDARKTTYFDAMWRPVVEEALDVGVGVGSLSQTVKRYDANGHLVYQSNPMRGLANYTVPTLGVRTTYDVLNRVIDTKQDSEIGVLTTSNEYLSGFQTRTTNPRLQSTTTTYRAYDQPSTDWPMAISHPEGANTNIVRNELDQPRSVTRSNADASVAVTRHYVYDTQQRLCKTVEPETAATVQDYDPAGNVAWSASGLALLSPTACDTEAVLAGVKVNRNYDSRNRLSTMVFPDGNGTQSWNYTPDGLPEFITTLNVTDEGTTSAVNAYTYNKRRLLTGESLHQSNPDYTWALGYGYNVQGHVASHSSPGLTVNYAPNALGQPTQAGGYATGVSYFPNGAMKQFTYGNGIEHNLEQYSRGLPERSSDSYGGVPVHDDSYAFDANGNLLAISDGVAGYRGNRDMTYDGLDRLISTDSPMFGAANYGYDALDNLTRVLVGGSAARDHYYCYDARWQLTNVKTTSCGGSTVIGLSYDDRGNVDNKNGQAYKFDFGNRLREATNKEKYRYDGHGRRIQAKHPTLGDIYSMYGSDGVLRYQQDYRTQKVSSYVYLNGSLVARVTEPTTPVPAELPPANPPALTAPAQGLSGAYTVTWTTVQTATSYTLEQSANGGGWTPAYTGPTQSQAFSGKAAGSYGYRVKACNLAGCSGWSASATVQVIYPPATAPTASVPAQSLTGGYTVNWTAVATSTSYRLEENLNGTGWTLNQDAFVISRSFAGKAAGSYSYRVAGCNAAGCGPTSSVVGLEVIAAPSVAPTLTVPATSSTGSYTVSWTAVSGATHYRLAEKRGGSPGVLHPNITSTSKAAVQDTGTIEYFVAACNAAGCGPDSATKSIVVQLPGIPSVPAAPSVQTGTNGCTVEWGGSQNTTSHRLMDVNDNFSTYPATTTQVLSTCATAPYRVAACNANGCSAYSAPSSDGELEMMRSAP